MKKLSRGAFSMVLAGAVTFSVTNALLVERLVKEHSLIIYGDQIKSDVTKEKMTKDQTPKTNVEDGHNKLSDNIADSQAALKKSNDRDMALAAIQQNTKKSTNVVSTSAANENAATTTSASTVTSAKAPAAKPIVTAAPAKTAAPTQTAAPTVTAKPAQSTKPKTTGTSAATTTTNNGHEVSQAAKEKAESRQDNKENNGKKM